MMGLGMLTKITRNGYSNLKFLKSNSNTFHQRSIISENSTISPCHLQKICSPNGVVSGTKGFFPNPVVGGRFFSNALWKQRRSSIPVTIRNTRFYNSFKSLDSGRRSSFKSFFTTDGVTIGLIVTNVAVFLLWKVADTQFMVNNFMISVENFKCGRLHTLITSGFTHHDTFHFVTNMMGLYFFGTTIGQFLGRQYSLMLYLSGAVAGSIFNLAYYSYIDSLSNDQGVSYSKFPTQGASGAMNPIVLAGVILQVGKDYLRLLEDDSGYAHVGGQVVCVLVTWKLLKGRFRLF